MKVNIQNYSWSYPTSDAVQYINKLIKLTEFKQQAKERKLKCLEREKNFYLSREIWWYVQKSDQL